MSGMMRVQITVASLLALASCQAPAPSATPTATSAGQAPTPIRATVKLYSGSSTGLVVGESASGGNPASSLPGQAFVENPGLAKTFIWSFPEGAAVLDGQCHAITRTQAINIANAPGANSVVFIEAAGGGSIAVQMLPAKGGAAADCPAP